MFSRICAICRLLCSRNIDAFDFKYFRYRLDPHLKILPGSHFVVASPELCSQLQGGVEGAVNQVFMESQAHGTVMAKLAQPRLKLTWGNTQMRYVGSLA